MVIQDVAMDAIQRYLQLLMELTGALNRGGPGGGYPRDRVKVSTKDRCPLW